MADTQTFDLNELFQAHADAEAVKEANTFSALPAGKYRLTTQKVEGRIQNALEPQYVRDTTPDWLITGGARLVHLQVQAKAKEGSRVGTLFIDISPETLRRRDGKLDTPSKLWGQYEKALGVVGKNAGDVLTAIQQYPVDASISLAFKKPEGGYVYPKTAEEVAKCEAEGLEAKNFVQSVYAARD